MSDPVNERPQFDEFPVPTYDAWRAKATQALKGAPFEKKLLTRTLEGITLKPLYFQEDVAALPHLDALPGQAPYVRGIDAAGYLGQPWLIAQEIVAGTPQDFNDALLHDLERGQTAVNLRLDEPTRAGLDPDQASAEEVGVGGISLASLDDWQTALKGVDLEKWPLFARTGTVALPLAALLVALMRRQGREAQQLSGCLENDPLGVMAHQGTLPLSLERAYDEMATLTTWAAEHAPALDTIAVHTTPYHNGGAHAVQELAYALATGVEYLRALQARGLDINTAAKHMRFVFAIGGHFFMEIAKFRAARLLWSRVVDAFGGDLEAQQMVQHARTGEFNKTVYDPYVNMLRTSIEALAGALGGVQSLHVMPFDAIIRTPDAFSRRVARNQQLILQEEAHLTKLVDPAGGSWYVEALTDDIARQAWALFQQIEGEGGMFAALKNQSVQIAVAGTAVERANRLAQRRDTLIGTNRYPNLQEKALEAPPSDPEARYQQRAAAIRAYRTHDDTTTHTAALDKLGQMLEAAPQDVMEAAIQAALAGATLNELTRTLRLQNPESESESDPEAQPNVVPVCLHRIAEPYERLRQNATRYAATHGHPPQIFMANIGQLINHKARADFTRGFYEVGGFDLIATPGFNTPAEAASAALDSGAPAVVVCGQDADYPAFVPPLVAHLREQKPEVVVILAGLPSDETVQQRLSEAGVDGFIHVRANCYQMNRTLQDRLGVL